MASLDLNSRKGQLIPIRRKRRWLGSILYLIGAAWRLINRLKKENPSRVLVLEPFGLGDIITFDPLVRELLDSGFEAVICSRPEYKALYPERPGQKWEDFHVPFATPDEGAKYQLSKYVSDPFRGDLKRLRKIASGAIGIEPRGDIRCVILLYAMGCRRVISLSNYLGSNLSMWPITAEVVPFTHDVRRWELNLRFGDAVKRSRSDRRPGTRPFLDHLSKPEISRRVGLMPIAPWAGKWWPPERWQNVARELRAKGFDPLGLCGPGQHKITRERLGEEISVIEVKSVQGWATEFNRCAFVITIDSGPMHLADALGIPVIVLFGQGMLPLWAPSGPESIILHHQNDADFRVCQPLDANIPLGQKFMNRITVEEVMHAVEKVEEQIRRSGRLPH